MTTTALAPSALLHEVARIGREVARPAAARVDAEAAFPTATFAALAECQALSAALPLDLGGAGANILELSAMCQTLGRHCGSSAMVLAMHHIQVLCLLRHSRDVAPLRDYLRRVASEQRLLASATSEVGPSGDMRRSVCAVERDGPFATVSKRATTVSYGEHAHDLLLTARRAPDAAPSDQVLVLLQRGDYELRDVGRWDTLGMRGTRSPAALVVARVEPWQVLPEPFGDIASATMVPTSHVLWSSTWLGIASDAVDRARSIVRQKARKDAEAAQQAALELAAVDARLQLVVHDLAAVAREYHAVRDDREALTSFGFALRVNNLKVNTSELATEIVTGALRVAGIAAYTNDPQLSMGRHLRDLHSAALMINNQRIRERNASLLLIHKGTTGDAD